MAHLCPYKWNECTVFLNNILSFLYTELVTLLREKGDK